MISDMEIIINNKTEVIKLTDSEIEQIRNVSIHRILSVQNNGRMISVRCPFHKEKTPSCVLYPDNSFYCFGCQAKGRNAIDFVTQMGYSFPEAIQELIGYL